MANTIIRLTIDPNAIINTPDVGVITDGIIITFNNGATSFTFEEKFFPVRYRPNAVTTKSPDIGNDVNAANLATSINLDSFPDISIYATSLENIVTITVNELNVVSVTGTMVDNGKILSEIDPGDLIVPKTVEITSYTSGLPNVCEDANAIVSVSGGNNLYNVYLDNVLSTSNQTSPIEIPLKRGTFTNIRIVDTLGELMGSATAETPRKIISSGINTTVTNTNSGTNVSVTVEYISPFLYPYNYSLDGSNYIAENIFTSLVPADYTIYVKDAFGCVTTKDIVVDGETTITETIFSISEINAIRYSRYEPEQKKNFKNTLSCNSLRLTKYPYSHKFIETDAPVTQFKTNAKYINIFALKEDLTTVDLTPIKRTENIGLSAKSTSTYFSLGDDKSAIYFGAVDLLDPITNAVIGNTDYGFALPVWANKAGDFVTIEGLGDVEIDSIGYSDIYSSFILEFNISYSGGSLPKNISANYNLQPYEIYEFTSPMASLPERYNIVIETGISSGQVDFTYVSEGIKRVEDSEFLFEIDYWDDSNIGDMVYQTGIKNKLRLNGYVDYVGEQTTSGYDGDKKYYVTDNTVYNSENFTFNRLSFQMAQKLRLIVAHSNLVINGVYYDLAEEPEVSGDSNYNLKRFSVTLKPNGDLLLDNVSEGIVGTSESLEISSAITAIQGKALLLWTKNNG